MKIGVISDTHLTSVTPGLTKVMEQTFAQVDLVLHAGDITGPAVLAYLEGLGVVAVAGNMDGPQVSGRLPIKRVIEAEGLKIGLVHGWGGPEGLGQRLRREFEAIDCLVFGHSHQPENTLAEGVLFFNPGAYQGRSFPSSVGIVHVAGGAITGEIINI